MKTKLLISLCFIAASINCFATHYRAGEITYRYLGNFQVEATVTLYSRFDGISIQPDKDMTLINWGDGTTDSVCRSNGIVNPSGCRDGVIISATPSIKKSEYVGVHTYARPPLTGFYIISWFDMNRIDGINNIDNGNSVNIPMYLEDTVFLSRMPEMNVSPRLLNPPVDYANTNDTFTYNSVAYDEDGDSVSFELAIPKQDKDVNVPVYAYPDQYCQTHSFPNNVFEINSVTGEIIWATPCQTGIYNIAFITREYRCGVLLSTILRDMQIIVLNENNDPPVLGTVHDTVINPGDSIAFNVTATDQQPLQTVALSSIGGGFELAHPATFQTTAGNPANGTFSWRTDSASARKSPYIFSVIAKDNYTIPGNPPIVAPLSIYQTFRVWVTDTSDCTFTSIGTEAGSMPKASTFHLHPNPATDHITISIDNVSTSAEVVISDVTGRKMLAAPLQTPNTKLQTGQLANGVYLVTVTSAGRSATRRLVISR